MPDTRPGELSRIEARRIAHETAAVLAEVNLDNDREYRERILSSLVRLEVKHDSLKESIEDHKEAFERHIQEDRINFGNVTQNINENKNWINKGIGIALAVVSMFGVIMWIIDRFHTVK